MLGQLHERACGLCLRKIHPDTRVCIQTGTSKFTLTELAGTRDGSAEDARSRGSSAEQSGS